MESLLRQQGHDILAIGEVLPRAPDERVLAIALEQDCLFITIDTDFGELVCKLREQHAGVLLARLYGLPTNDQASAIADAIAEHGPELLGALSVLNHRSLRIRRPPAT